MEALVGQVMASSTVRLQLEVHTENLRTYAFKHLPPTPENLKKIESCLSWWAQEVVKVVLANTPLLPDQTDPEWKSKVSNWVYHALDYPVFEKNLSQELANKIAALTGQPAETYLIDGCVDPLLGSFLVYVSNATGGAAYMLKLGLDPDLLRMTREESQKQLERMAIQHQQNGGTVLVVGTMPVTAH